MNEKAERRKRICQIDFAIHELTLYLDTHPESRKAMELLEQFRERRDKEVAAYEEKFGKYVVTSDQTPPSDSWEWIDSPWPWENNFMEA